MTRFTPALVLAGLASAFTGGMAARASAATETFSATLDAKTEVPPKTSQGTGTVTATLDTATKILTYESSFANLTGAATMAHFHGPAAPGANAGVAVPWPTPVASPVHATVKLTDAQEKDLEAGKWYANVHTAANPGGEIRGQMMKTAP